MLRIRLKMGPQTRNKEWTCIFGIHVYTATIIIGLWHLCLNILALCLLAIIASNPEMMDELENGYDVTVDMDAPELPTPLSKVDPPYAYHDHSLYSKPYRSFDMGGVVCACMIAITLMMLYGVIKRKPANLLPFFCLQLFDFAITALTAAGYICYLQAFHRLIAESRRLPWREKLLQLSPDELILVVMVVFLGIVFLKAYCIGIVWRCYKYLMLRQQTLRTLLPCIIPELGIRSVGEERDYSTLLPNYEEATVQYKKQAPPPSYQVAMSNIRVVENDANVNADAIDNNNDIPNNNNTMHVNANAVQLVREENATTGPTQERAIEGNEQEQQQVPVRVTNINNESHA